MKRDTARIFEKFIRQADDLNARVQNETEANRKRRAYVTVTKDGVPVSGAKVRFRQKDHEFKFGANCFMLDELETEEKNEAYKKYFAKAFNLATLPFYWDTLEPVQGQPRFTLDSPKIYRRPAPDLCINFCKEHHIEPKLHCLVYDHFSPDWYRKASVPEQKKMIEARMAAIAERYADVIPDMEVTNEVTHWKFSDSPAFYNEPDYVEWSYRTADRYFPRNNLVINEGVTMTFRFADRVATRQGYYLLIKDALSKGLRIDKIGIQHHIWQMHPDDYENTRVLFDPDNIFSMLDAYGGFGKEMQITETTFPARGNLPEDEEYQAEVLDRLYRIWFSHKNMQAIIYWNLVDGYAHGAKPGDMSKGENQHYGGLINFDLTPKKSYYKLLELTQKEWHTEGDTVTNDGGELNFRGFCGTYELEIYHGDRVEKKEISVSKYSKNQFTVEL